MDDSNAIGALSRLVAIIELLAIPQDDNFRKPDGGGLFARPLAWLTAFGLIALGDWLDILPVSVWSTTNPCIGAAYEDRF